MAQEEATYCKHCKYKTGEKFYPTIHEADGGLFYARCPNCSYYSPYDFIGSTRNGAIRNWNTYMGSTTSNGKK